MVKGGVTHALERVKDREPEAMDGHLVEYLDEGGRMRCGQWFTRPSAWKHL